MPEPVPRFPDGFPPPPPGETGWPWTADDAAGGPEPGPGPWPRISLVTPSYQQGRFLETAIRSVLGQGYPNLEYMVIDGGSTDETVSVIRKYEPWLRFWVSERDSGQSEAINKGLDRSTGEVFNWLNSDDFLAPGALWAVGSAWRDRPGSIIAGQLAFLKEDGSEQVVESRGLTVENFVRWRTGYERGLSFVQPATFLPRSAVQAAGGVREDLHLVMDHLLMIELLQHCPVVYLPRVLAKFRLHADSKTRVYGHARFMLEIMDALAGAPSLPVAVSPEELRREHARVLVACADAEASEGRWGRSVCYLTRALVRSTTAAIGELRRLGVPGRAWRKLRRGFSSNRP